MIKHKSYIGVQQTSINAYKDIMPVLGDKQLEVLRMLKARQPATNSELARYLGWRINTVTPRVYELRQLELVEEAGKRSCDITGRRAMTWQLSGKGGMRI